jgi:hypothetical protein
MSSLKIISIGSYSQKERQRILWLLVALSALIFLVFGYTGIPLNTDAAPYGIVSFETAGSIARAEQILNSWDASARERAAFSLGLDFLFIPVYVGAVILGIHRAADKIYGHLKTWRSWLTWALLFAGLLDIVENIVLLTILFISPIAPLPLIAKVCALPKFAFILVGVLYAFFGTVFSRKNSQ